MSGLVVIGDTLLDRDVHGTAGRVCPDAPALVLSEQTTVDRPGGAGLAALLAAADGHEVTLVTPLAEDAGGARLSQLLTEAGITVYPVPATGPTPEKIRLRAGGQVLLRLDRGDAAAAPGPPTGQALAAVREAGAVLVSDYGRGVTGLPEVRAAIAEAAGPVVWDPHPRGASAVPGARLVTPNEAELVALTGVAPAGAGRRLATLAHAAQRLRDRWRAGAVAVTLGADGALLCRAGASPMAVPVREPSPAWAGGDSCGAGDRFAAAAALALAADALVPEAVEHAVAQAASFVATGGAGAFGHYDGAGATGQLGGAPAPPVPAPAPPVPAPAPLVPAADPGDAGELVGRVRARGGTVVATGGCFDLLHAGHVATLQAARQLGDCLVVCVNSDTSVARLKGPGRPLVPQADRVRLLSALGCVDAVLVFEEPTPSAVLSWLRPDIWVKGGDYGADTPEGPDLLEGELVRRWGGQAVVVPYLAGRSTTSMIAAARHNGGRSAYAGQKEG